MGRRGYGGLEPAIWSVRDHPPVIVTASPSSWGLLHSSCRAAGAEKGGGWCRARALAGYGRPEMGDLGGRRSFVMIVTVYPAFSGGSRSRSWLPGFGRAVTAGSGWPEGTRRAAGGAAPGHGGAVGRSSDNIRNPEIEICDSPKSSGNGPATTLVAASGGWADRLASAVDQ
jgi:hypothetical protein